MMCSRGHWGPVGLLRRLKLHRQLMVTCKQGNHGIGVKQKPTFITHRELSSGPPRRPPSKRQLAAQVREAAFDRRCLVRFLPPTTPFNQKLIKILNLSA